MRRARDDRLEDYPPRQSGIAQRKQPPTRLLAPAWVGLTAACLFQLAWRRKWCEACGPVNEISELGTKLVLGMALHLVSIASATGVERVGWAFAEHGGFPPTPTSWGRSGVVRDFTVAYFMGNASGPNNAAEVAAEARFGIAGIGWQINNKPGVHHFPHLPP